jgi:serine/threonine-protein kinase
MSQDNANRAAGEPTDAYEPQARERYTLLRLHAKGGIGQVWVAHDDELGRQVALKELRTDRPTEGSIRARFINEARITGQLEHPGVVPVYELVEGTGEHAAYYTMRLIRGHNLKQAIEAYHRERLASRAGPLALRDLLTSFVAICNTIAYAHARRVLHRDLKPENIVLGDFGEVIVLDWGLARLMDRLEPAGPQLPVSVDCDASADHTLAGQVVGTPSYLSPEQAEGRLDLLDERSDVYGLGAVLYEILTCEPPYSSGTPEEVVQRVLREALVPPRQRVTDVPRALEAVCQKALAKTPGERYTSARELAREVEHFLADEPVTAWPEPWPVRARRWLARHRTATIATAATILAATVILAVSTVLLTQANERERLARAAEQQARLKAEKSFRLAQNAVDNGFTKVSESAELKAVGVEKVRKDLLAQARDFYESLVAEHGAEPGLGAERGRSYLRLAQITAELGDRVQAIALAQHARDLFEGLLRERSGDSAIQDALAGSLEVLGDNYYETGSMQEAVDVDKKSVELRELLAASGSSIARFRLALGLNQLGLVQSRGLGRPADGQVTMNRALALCEALTRESPSVATYALAQADILRNLSISKSDTGDFRGSIESLMRELPLRERLAKEDPSVIVYQCGWGRCLMALSNQTSNVRQLEQSQEYSVQASEIVERLVDKHPLVPEYKNMLARIHVTRAGTISMMGDYRQAVAEVEKGVTIAPQDGLTCYNASCAYAGIAAASGRDAKLPALERQQQAERYALRAVELLRQTKKAGLFQRVAAVTFMTKDPDLDPIRDREDFRAFLREVQPSKPNPK